MARTFTGSPASSRINFSRVLSPTARTREAEGPTNLEDAITRELGILSESPFDPESPDFQTEQKVPFLADLERSISDIRGRETATTPTELAGLEGLFESADPSLQLQKAQDFINQIVGPANQAAATKAGFGRGPAAVEATTRAGAELALPIVTEASRQSALANQFKVALEHARLGRVESKDRAVFEAVLNKVQQGQTTAGRNAAERAALGQFNLGKAQVGLSTQDRTLALLNQLRAIRTSQAGINAGLRPSGGGGGGAAAPDLGAQAEARELAANKIRLGESAIAATERQARFTREAQQQTARVASLGKLPSLSSFGGLASGGGAPAGSTAKSPLFVTSTGPAGAQRKTLFGSSVFS